METESGDPFFSGLVLRDATQLCVLTPFSTVSKDTCLILQVRFCCIVLCTGRFHPSCEGILGSHNSAPINQLEYEYYRHV